MYQRGQEAKSVGKLSEECHLLWDSPDTNKPWPCAHNQRGEQKMAASELMKKTLDSGRQEGLWEGGGCTCMCRRDDG